LLQECEASLVISEKERIKVKQEEMAKNVALSNQVSTLKADIQALEVDAGQAELKCTQNIAEIKTKEAEKFDALEDEKD